MKSNIRKIFSASVIALALGAGGANAMVHVDQIGTPLGAGNVRVDRVISIDSSTRWINVSYGEIVRIVIGGDTAKSVVFRFDGNALAARLSDIAPSLGSGGNLPIYVNQSYNPMVSAATYN